jgi:small conductance mechanosensitive channel
MNMKNQITIFCTNLIDWGLNNGIKIIFIVVIAYVLKLISKRFVQRIVKAAVSSDKFMTTDGEIKRMQTLVRIFSWTINTIIIVIATMMVLQEFGVQIGPILASAGIVGVAIGFGGQYLVKDVITGFFIILENQYRIGDVINIEGISGTVEDISLRVTTLRDANGTVHYIPHGEVKKVSNFTRNFATINFNIGVSYDANLDHVIAVINKVGNDLANDPKWKDSINRAPFFLRVDALDASSVNVKISGETKAQKQWEVTGELLKRIKETFDKEGIEIPYPQTVVHLSKDSNLIQFK